MFISKKFEIPPISAQAKIGRISDFFFQSSEVDLLGTQISIWGAL
jgi:hypothetical protein